MATIFDLATGMIMEQGLQHPERSRCGIHSSYGLIEEVLGRLRSENSEQLSQQEREQILVWLTPLFAKGTALHDDTRVKETAKALRTHDDWWREIERLFDIANAGAFDELCQWVQDRVAGLVYRGQESIRPNEEFLESCTILLATFIVRPQDVMNGLPSPYISAA